MPYIPYTILRSGIYYYNRRVPKHAVKSYGSFIRRSLSKCPEDAKSYANRLNHLFEGSWRRTANVSTVDISSVLASFLPRSSLLSEIAEEYFAMRAIDKRPSIL